MTTATDHMSVLLALLEPLCYVERYRHPLLSLRVKGPDFGPYGFDVLIKPGPGCFAPEATAREIRAGYLERAEGVIDILSEAGWQLTQYPQMAIDGEVRRFSQFLDGELAEPSQQSAISMKMSFEVDRPR